jgi:hypothetical protein
MMQIFQQVFTAETGGVLAWTRNAGVIPSAARPSRLRVFQQGQKLTSDLYTIADLTGPTTSEITIDPDTHYDGAVYQVILTVFT